MENTIKHHYRIRLRSVAAALLACFCLLATSCDDNKSTPAPTQNIVAIAQGNPQLSTLVTALTRFPDLVTTLSGNGTFTVFAPTNQAFASLLTAIGQTSLDNVPDAVLRKILEYHVISTAALQSTQLVAGTRNTVANENITITLTGGLRLNTSVSVTAPNVQASNGVVHVVDAVLVNPSIAPIVGTIVAPAYFNKDFTTLIAAVNAASPEILTTLLNSSKKTLFAPNNAAFVAAGITTLPAQAELDKILKYHVLNSEVRAAGLPTNTAPVNSEITTLQGKFYVSNRGATGVFINGRTKVTQTDIIATNGVVHLIDRTLSPPSQTIAQIATALSTATAPQFTKLIQALSRTEAAAILATASDASANITLFAPTDAAFEASGINLTTVDGNTLVAVLQQHIISSPTTTTGRIFSRDLVTGNVASLNGDIAINATNLTVTSGGVTANISATTPTLINVLGTNGVIHAIDKVLLP